MTDDRVARVADVCLNGRDISCEDALYLAEHCPLDQLLYWAEGIRDAYLGRRVELCSIISARSGNCSEDCAFCAQSAYYSTSAPSHALYSTERLVDAARMAAANGVHCFGIVTSGYAASAADLVTIAEALHQLRALNLPLRLGASLGCLSYGQLCFLRDAGLDHYNHNLETSESFYPRICSTHPWRERHRTVTEAKKAGLDVCSGGIFGVGEAWTDRIELALILRQLDIRNVPINFLTPIPGTGLADRQPLAVDEALRIVALYRFILPNATIRICGGRPGVPADRQPDLFRAGASGLLTGNYLTTAGVDASADRQMVLECGLNLE